MIRTARIFLEVTMARPKKKNSDPKMSMEQLLNRAVTLFQEPYDDRDERDVDLPSLRTVAEELNTTILRSFRAWSDSGAEDWDG